MKSTVYGKKIKKTKDGKTYVVTETDVDLPENGTVTLGKAYAPGFGLKVEGESVDVGSVYASPAKTENKYSFTPDSESAEKAVSDGAAAKNFTYGASKPVYASPYSEAIDKLYSSLNSTPVFSYNPEEDEAYLALRDSMSAKGKLAAKDTAAKAAALTGGIGSSYAASAATQAYQQYMNALDESVPELRSLAYEIYKDGLDSKRENLDTLIGLEKEAYSRYGDELDDYYRGYDRAYAAYSDSLEREDALEREAYEREADALKFDYEKEQDALDRQYDYDVLDYRKYSDALDRSDEREREEYERERDALDRAWEEAFARAEYGDLSGLESLGVNTDGYEEKAAASDQTSDSYLNGILRRCVFSADGNGGEKENSKAEAYVMLRRLFTSEGISDSAYKALVKKIELYYG